MTAEGDDGGRLYPQQQRGCYRRRTGH